MPPSPTELLEGACIFGGLIALVIGVVLGHSSPIFAHSDPVAAPLLEVAKSLTGLLPTAFRIELKFKKTGPPTDTTEDFFLLGGDAAGLGESGCGGLFAVWDANTLQFGVQCNGPSPCPNGDASLCSDPVASGPATILPGVEHALQIDYSRVTHLAVVAVDGKNYLSKKVRLEFPHDGSVR
jgi:hypothetical protein